MTVLNLYFTDDVLASMCDPVMVLPRVQTVEDMEDGKPERVAVAKLGSKPNHDNEAREDNDLIWTYVEIVKNRVFESTTTDTEAAYQEFLASLNHQKVKKSEKLVVKRTKEETEMVFIMKCCVIAYLDFLQDSEMTKIDPLKIESILTENTQHVLQSIMPVYFKTAMALGVVVNNPYKIYKTCVNLHCNGIRQAIVGSRKLDVEENDVYIEAMTIIRDRM